MGELLIVFGGLSALFSAFELLGCGKFGKKFKRHLMRTFISIGVIGIGLLLKHFGI